MNLLELQTLLDYHYWARDRLLDAAEALDKRAPTYYGAAWVALGRIMLMTSALDSCK